MAAIHLVFQSIWKSRKVPHAIRVDVVSTMVKTSLILINFVAIVDVPNHYSQVARENDESRYVHGNTHVLGVLRCLMAIEKRRMVPGQCAVYSASSVCPIKPRLTE